MREFFVVFRSRTEAVRFLEGLQSYGISCKLINTPSGAKAGCGLSVKLFAKDMQMAHIVLERGKFSSVVGFFCFSQGGGVIKL